MKKTNIILISAIGVAGILIAWYVFSSSDSTRNFQWYESYKGDSEQPYGALFVRKMLETYRPGSHFYYNTKKSVSQILDSVSVRTGVDYVFVGQSNNLDNHDIAAMTGFINRGNDVFIASLDVPTEVITAIYSHDCISRLNYFGESTDSVTMNFYHDSLRRNPGYHYTFRYAGIDRAYPWTYLDPTALCDSTVGIVPIGYRDGNAVNFFKIPYGKGNLYLHSNPLVFTNYFLIHQDKMEYAAGVFSHLKGKDIIWDEYSKLPFVQNNNSYNSPLYFILQQPSLKYAWWMMLATILLFVLFAAKRKQRVIPVLEPKMNTSLEFVNMISSLHFQNMDHLDMAKKKMKYFLYFIRAKYGIHTSAFTIAHVPVLAEKSKVKEADVQNIFDRWNVIEIFGSSGIEDFRLSELYFAIDKFYKQCR